MNIDTPLTPSAPVIHNNNMENTAHSHTIRIPTLERTGFACTPVPDNNCYVVSKADTYQEASEVRKEPPTPPAPLPDWLTAYTPEEQRAMENGKLPRFPRTKSQLELEEQVFDLFFERFLDELVDGELGIDIVQRDPRQISYGRFMRWLKKDSKRVERYEEAKEIQTSFLEDKKHKIAEGLEDPMQDITRSKLQIDVISDTMKAWNKRRYGQEKEQSQPFGAGGIVINIGAVESPYQQITSGITVENTVDG